MPIRDQIMGLPYQPQGRYVQMLHDPRYAGMTHTGQEPVGMDTVRAFQAMPGQIADWAQANPLDAGALAVSPVPIAGDIAGFANDMRHMIQNPEERTWGNAALAGAGLLPFVPPMAGMVRGVKGAAALTDLPMDEASRMARADEMFPIDAYHGTNKDIKSFDPSARGGVTRAKSAQGAHWFTDDAKTTASGYADLAGKNEVQKLIDASMAAERRGDWDTAHNLIAEAEKLDQVIGRGENVMPVRLRGKLKEVDMDGAQYDPDDINLSKILKDAKAEGFNGVQFNNFSDEAGYGVYNPSTHYAIFDPKNIRSRFAKFDPAMKDSADLLAGIAGASVITPAMIDALLAENEGQY
jgi:hypothetical protein